MSGGLVYLTKVIHFLTEADRRSHNKKKIIDSLGCLNVPVNSKALWNMLSNAALLRWMSTSTKPKVEDHLSSDVVERVHSVWWQLPFPPEGPQSTPTTPDYQARSKGGASECNAPIRNPVASTSSLQNIINKHAHEAAKSVRHPVTSVSCLCWTAVVANNSF